MDHIRILKRAFSITTSYRALWVFGILVALTAGGNFSGGSNGGGGSGGPGSGSGTGLPTVSPEVLNAIIIAGIVIICHLRGAAAGRPRHHRALRRRDRPHPHGRSA
jgi:hypothetical protein